MSVVVVGLNHRSIRLDVLESMSVAPDALPKALADLRRRDHLGEVAVVSTCMRTEVYAESARFHGAAGDVRAFLSDWSGHPPEVFADGVYEFWDDRAVEHLFRVASGLESAVLGEGEILRQVRTAWDVARAEGTIGVTLGSAMRRAVEAGKRVRSETAIARGTTSLSHTAVMLAGEALAGAVAAVGDGSAFADAVPCNGAEILRDRRAVVLGTGEMGAAVATLMAGGPGDVVIANRTGARAEALAAELGAGVVPWSDVGRAVAGADLVISATSAPGYVLDAATVADATVGRTGRPLVIVDLALPRDVDPAAGALPGVDLLDLDDLEAHARRAMDGRSSEVPAAEAILAEELERWTGAVAERSVAPIVAAMFARGEAVRASELDRFASRLRDLAPEQRNAVEALTRGIVAKLLHDPTVNLKAAAAGERGPRLAAALAELWDLPSPGSW